MVTPRLLVPWLLNIHHLPTSLSLRAALILAKVLLLRVSVIALLLLRVLLLQPFAEVVVRLAILLELMV
jgi:hypothetical protein